MNSEKKKIIELLHEEGIYIQDIISILFDLRPCIRYSLTKERYFVLKDLLPKLGLKMVIYNFQSINKHTCLIGKDKKILDKYYIDNSKSDDRIKEMGAILGYPDCCCSFFQNKIASFDEKMLFSEKSRDYDYRLNFLFNFNSRVKPNENHFLEEFKVYAHWDKYLLPYIPCSFHCKRSIDFAITMSNLLETYFPAYLKEIEHFLKLPLLFINKFQFVAFDGEILNNELKYNSVYDLGNLTEQSLLNTLKLGNKLQIMDHSFNILKDDILLKAIKSDVYLLNFK